MKVLAISGFKRSGKDTVADYLVKNKNFKRVAFADPLKDLCSSEYGVDRTHFDSVQYKEFPIYRLPVQPKDGFSRTVAEFMVKEFVDNCSLHPIKYGYDSKGNFKGIFEEGNSKVERDLYHTPRSLAILKGSTNRVVSPDYWVNRAAKMIEVASITQKNFVIPDLRYRSEIQELETHFGSDLVTIKIDRFDKVESNDPSELDLVDYNKFHHVVENKGTIEEFLAKIEEIAKKYE
jgi:hypothetical protein